MKKNGADLMMILLYIPQAVYIEQEKHGYGKYYNCILWSVCSLLVMIQYAPCVLVCQDWLLAGIIFIIGGPFFAIVNVLEAILDCIMPEGWDDETPRM